ncbi:MAG TPA: hypothetical protein V6C88_10370 [Chroococcidiopsis sp.]
MSTLKTFQIKNNQQSIDNAIVQCVAALMDLGCSSKIIYNQKSIRVASEEAITNIQTGKTSKVSFKLQLI